MKCHEFFCSITSKCTQNGDIPRSLPAKNSSIPLAQALHFGYFSTTMPLPPTGNYQNNRSFSQTKSQSHKQQPSKKCTFPGMEASYTKNEGSKLRCNPRSQWRQTKLHTHNSPRPHSLCQTSPRFLCVHSYSTVVCMVLTKVS